ncbi:MAG: glucosamine-6-phosphate isomerase [Anaerolineaceae bacterium]|nr:glucosamine-6-phosphate isomerase [Anaerolineaceae bacterium]
MHPYYQITAQDLGKGSKIPLCILGESGEVFYELALEMIREIEKNNEQNKPTVMICPVGPVGQYPIFTRLVNERRLDLKHCWFINMDEHLTDEGQYIDESSPRSFRGFMKREVYDRIDTELLMPQEQRIFPDPSDPEAVQKLIGSLGGVGLVIGGIGINGHVAFNEPDPSLTPAEFAALHTRVLWISPETRTSSAIGDLGGNIEDWPKKCITIGMAEILGARKIRLGVFRDWHRAVVRRAAYGEVSAGFPATLLQNHPDAVIYVNNNAAKLP